METQRRNFLMGSQLGRKSQTAVYAPQTVKKSVSTTTYGGAPAQEALVPTLTAHEYISARSVDQNPTMPLLGSAGSVLHERPRATDFSSITAPQFLPYRDFSNTIIHRDPLITADEDLFGLSDNIFLRIVHPYDISAFETLISTHDLTFFYPLLATNLRNGFPLGQMPPLTDTVIFKNHPSTLLHSDVVNQYLTDEIGTGRMSGPFSLQHVENILRGPIFCSPLLISVQVQQPGTPDKLRVCRHLSKGNKNIPSMNSHINKEDFPTRFDTASRVADIVRSFLTDLRFLTYLHGLHLWWPHFFMGFTSGGLLFMGFTSGGLTLHGFHLWWPSLHGHHLWWPILHGFNLW